MGGAARSWKTGGCHCGAVKWEAETENDVVVEECNCSMCRMVGFQHLIVPASRFRLLEGDDVLTRYTFNTGVAKHFFCKRCGVKSYYIPRSNPDGFSLNFRCMERAQFNDVEFKPFDGENWEQNAASLAHLSCE
jgi:hypothetical protein